MTGVVAVLGSSGFIGRAVVESLRERQIEVRPLAAPRLAWPGTLPRSVVPSAMIPDQRQVDQLADRLRGVQTVVNAAGIANADALPSPALFGANALMPLTAAHAAAEAGVARYLHVSSVVVQGTRALDETTDTVPFSPYSLSRAVGEALLLHEPRLETVIYRPSPVHGSHKANTRSLVRLARSRFACVAGDGSRPTPQALIDEVGAAMVFICRHAGRVPPVVLHPHNGMTTGMLLRLLGGKEPRHLPFHPTRRLLDHGLTVTRRALRMHANVRRLDMLLFGREQVPGWLKSQGFRPTVDVDAWQRLGRTAEPSDQGLSQC